MEQKTMDVQAALRRINQHREQTNKVTKTPQNPTGAKRDIDREILEDHELRDLFTELFYVNTRKLMTRAEMTSLLISIMLINAKFSAIGRIKIYPVLPKEAFMNAPEYVNKSLERRLARRYAK